MSVTLRVHGALVSASGRAALLHDLVGQPAALRRVAEDAVLGRALRAVADAVDGGPLLLSGMGASLYAADVTAAALRSDGLEAWTLPASELAHHVSGLRDVPLVLISQSGASAELSRVVEARGAAAPVWCVTLNPALALDGVTPLVLPGALEQGYAATRSFTSTLVGLERLRSALGGPPLDTEAAVASVENGVATLRAPMAAAARSLGGVGALVVTARGALKGVAAYGALIAMELAALPASALDAGLLRHGPIEAFGPRFGVVALRAADAVASLTGSLARTAQAYGSPTLLLDAEGLGNGGADDVVLGNARLARGALGVATGGTDPPVAQRLRFPAGDELATWLGASVALQWLAIGLAEVRGRVPGEETRGSKVTLEE